MPEFITKLRQKDRNLNEKVTLHLTVAELDKLILMTRSATVRVGPCNAYLIGDEVIPLLRDIISRSGFGNDSIANSERQS